MQWHNYEIEFRKKKKKSQITQITKLKQHHHHHRHFYFCENIQNSILVIIYLVHA